VRVISIVCGILAVSWCFDKDI